MSDNIDIEEHDVLENPVIKNIFPDISIVKKEISEYYVEVPSIKLEPEAAVTEESIPIPPDIDIKADEDVVIDVENVIPSSNSDQNTSNATENIKDNLNRISKSTKIILGSKPNIGAEKSVDVRNISFIAEHNKQSSQNIQQIPPVHRQHIDESIYEVADETFESEYVPYQSTKIILGSKPVQNVTENKDTSEPTETKSLVRIPKVLIQDLGENIFESNRYCKECKTLYPTKLELFTHNQKFHSINKHKNDSNIIKTRNTNLKIKVMLKETNREYTHECPICGSCFNTLWRLSKHHRNIHEKKEPSKGADKDRKVHSCSICGSSFTDKANLRRHARIYHSKTISPLTFKNDVKEIKSHVMSESAISQKTRNKTNENRTSAKFRYNKTEAQPQCNVCGLSFSNSNNLMRHYKNIHKQQDPLRQASFTNHSSDSAVKTSIQKTEKLNNVTVKSGTIKSCFHCNEKFPDHDTLIDHIYSILRPKTMQAQSKKNKDDRILNDRNTDKIRFAKLAPNSFKDKIDFECDDADELLPSTSQPEQVENRDCQVNKAHFMEKKKIKHSRTRSNCNKSSLGIETQPFRAAAARLSSKNKRSYSSLDTSYEESNKRKRQVLNVNEIQEKNKSSSAPDQIKCNADCKAQNASKLSKVINEIYKSENKTKKSRNRRRNTTQYSNTTAHDKHVYRTRRRQNSFCKYFCDESESEDDDEKFHREFKSVKKFALKSIIYKCIKCDVHFVSSCVAKDHQKHMELLVNWKCSICNKIFKKHDKPLHLKQHKFSKTMNVCEFNEKELSRILYNCVKCSVHFTEDRYLEHYPNCGIEARGSVYCKKCDILIDSHGATSHEECHTMGKSTEDFIVMVGDLITASNLSETSEVSNKRKVFMEKANYVTFCDTCKCFLSNMAINRKAHMMRTCDKMTKFTCNLCGLVFTNKTINTHREHHKIKKNLTLQDFKFFDLNGIQIRPPIPDYPRCNNCDVSFVYKNSAKTHICSQLDYKVCEICNIKFSESAFNLHMNFHNYCMPGSNKSRAPNTSVKTHEYEIEFGNSHQEWLNYNSKESDVFVAKNNSKTNADEVTKGEYESGESDKITKFKKLTAFDKPDDNVSDKPVSNSDNFQATNEIMVNTAYKEVWSENEIKSKTPVHILEPDFEPIGNKDEHNYEQENNYITQSQFDNIIYSCQLCEIAITSYDKVIEHCRNHFSASPIDSNRFMICTMCPLRFEADCFERHHQMHQTCTNSDLQILTFDPVYFTAGYKIWTQHVFASVTPFKQKEIMNKSIYPPECRIKMDIIQRGPSHLTVYKCCKCGNFIDPDFLIDHLKEICHRKQRKFPCSVCGLPLNSSEFRTKHEEIHKEHDIRLKSYNIAMINCPAYKKFNDSIINAIDKYILYQCRSCDGIVEKQHRLDHQCDINDLKKCTDCGLVFYNKDFDRHTLQHRDLPKYKLDNLKVVMFGNNEAKDKILIPSFNGIICDYKLFKCESCEVCVNDVKYISRHNCVNDDSKWKCPKCCLYICSRSIKQHIKLHDNNAEFEIENIKIICFNYDDLRIETTKDPLSETKKDDKSSKYNDTTKSSDDKIEDTESVVLYRCVCGLHFIQDVAAKIHIKYCPPKIKTSRQNCSKCGLDFNPKELFAHIIAHHSDKNKTANYKIIEVKLDLGSEGKN